MFKTPTEEELGRMARAIGALFLNFSGLEHTLTLAVAATMKLTEDQERPLVRGMLARAKLDILTAYAKAHWNKEEKAKLASIVKPALKLVEYRNDIAHGLIVHDAEARFAIISFRGEHRFKGVEKPFTAEETLHQSLEAERLAHEFQRLADYLTGHLPTATTIQSG